MRVFVTGATGFVGSAVVRELLSHGHEVVGLARSDEGAAALAAAGAACVRGTLADLDVLKRAAGAAEGVIHTAFNHDFSRFAENSAEDREAILAMGEALEGSEKPLLVTAGLAFLAKDRLANEDDRPPPPSETYPRASEAAARMVAERGVRVGIVRLPPSVHGVGEHGFVPILIKLARETGVSAYVGDGRNGWAAVHRLDAARAFRLALEHGAREPVYHVAAEESVPFKAIAETIARHLDLPVVGQSRDEAQAHFTWFMVFASESLTGSSERTRRILGWMPREPDLLTDISQPAYYAS